MKIAYLVPGPMAKEEARRRGALLEEWAFNGTTVELCCVSEGPASVESMYEEYLSIRPTAALVKQLEKEGFDAVILGCAGDPGLDAMREITEEMLVIGPGQTSAVVAAMLGHRYAILTVAEGRIPSKHELAYKAGVLEKLCSVRPVNMPVLEIQKDRKAAIKVVEKVAREAVELDRADTIVLGCMSMGFLNVAEELTESLGVPVINPSKVGLKIAEALVASGLCHSKKAFRTPPKLRDGLVKSLDDLYISG